MYKQNEIQLCPIDNAYWRWAGWPFSHAATMLKVRNQLTAIYILVFQYAVSLIIILKELNVYIPCRREKTIPESEFYRQQRIGK